MKFRKFSANGALRNSGLIITICKGFQFGNEVRDFGQLAQHPIMKLVFDFLLLSFPIWLSVYIYSMHIIVAKFAGQPSLQT